MAETSFRLQCLDETNVAYVPEVFRAVYGEAYVDPSVYQPEELLRKIDQGQLQAVLPSYREQPAPIHVIWPTAAHMPAKTRCAIDALVAGTPSCLAGS